MIILTIAAVLIAVVALVLSFVTFINTDHQERLMTTAVHALNEHILCKQRRSHAPSLPVPRNAKARRRARG